MHVKEIRDNNFLFISTLINKRPYHFYNNLITKVIVLGSLRTTLIYVT